MIEHKLSAQRRLMLNAAQGKDTGDNRQPGRGDEEAELEDLRARYSSIPASILGFDKRVSYAYVPAVCSEPFTSGSQTINPSSRHIHLRAVIYTQHVL